MRAAIRLLDDHVCPSREGGQHVGGPVDASGCPTVLVERQAAARAGDTALCKVATDVIVKGSGTVIIGGMPAARILDLCHHEGHTLGGASEVFIGGPTSLSWGAVMAADLSDVSSLDGYDFPYDARSS